MHQSLYEKILHNYDANGYTVSTFHRCCNIIPALSRLVWQYIILA